MLSLKSIIVTNLDHEIDYIAITIGYFRQKTQSIKIHYNEL